jgi:RimJ/RimL family protein N-acetyltransferase
LATVEHERETERLVLRRWRPDDLDDLHRVFAKPEVWRYPLGRGCTLDETRRYLTRRLDEWASRGWSHWAAVHRADDRLIGLLGLAPPVFLPEIMPTVEVGWRLDPDYWGQGLAREGGRAALAFGFDTLGLDEIVSICEPENVASERVMQALGLEPARRTRHPELGVALLVYRITRDRHAAEGAPPAAAPARPFDGAPP